MSILPLIIPLSTSTVSVSIIDVGTRVAHYLLDSFAGPTIDGFERFDFGVNTFLIEHRPSDQKLLFDLGIGKEIETDYPPALAESAAQLMQYGVTLEIDRYVSEVLADESIPLESIDAIIWSHPHFDHTGRPSLFPNSTDLVVGSGVVDAFGPGYPTNENSLFLARELEGRVVTQLDFASSPSAVETPIGGLRAIDYFSDGSFYLLDAPGHEIGHMNGPARVTSNPDTFIHMGADTRQRALARLHLSPVPTGVVPPAAPRKPALSPAPLVARPGLSAGLRGQPDVADHDALPHRRRPVPPNANPVDPSAARDVLTKVQAFDADESVLLVSAHDLSLQGVVDFFPASANGWKAKGWKPKVRWQFLADFEEALKRQQSGNGTVSRVRRALGCGCH